MLNRILNALSKGVSNMDVVGWITAMYIVAWVAVYSDDIKRDLGVNKPTEQQEKVNGTTTSPQK